jgi:hypothetical protein
VAGVGGAGTVHHVAWASTMDDHQAWHDLVQEAGGNPTQIIDRFWFRSIYFREPAGVLFEIATLGPGFAADEEPAHLGREADPATGLRAPARPRRARANAAARPAGRLGRALATSPGSGSEDVSTTSKSAPVSRPSEWSWSFDQCRFGRPRRTRASRCRRGSSRSAAAPVAPRGACRGNEAMLTLAFSLTRSPIGGSDGSLELEA